MTTATAPAVEKRKKPWTKARVIDLIIDIFCFVIVGAASLTCILPFIHILAKSLSDNAYVVANRVILLPMSDAGINLDAYNKVFHDPTIMQSFVGHRPGYPLCLQQSVCFLRFVPPMR